MACNTIASTEPYFVGEIVELIHSDSLVLITGIDNIHEPGRGKGVIIRVCAPYSDVGWHTCALGAASSPCSPKLNKQRLPRYTGSLTDEESAFVARLLLLGETT